MLGKQFDSKNNKAKNDFSVSMGDEASEAKLLAENKRLAKLINYDEHKACISSLKKASRCSQLSAWTIRLFMLVGLGVGIYFLLRLFGYIKNDFEQQTYLIEAAQKSDKERYSNESDEHSNAFRAMRQSRVFLVTDRKPFWRNSRCSSVMSEDGKRNFFFNHEKITNHDPPRFHLGCKAVPGIFTGFFKYPENQIAFNNTCAPLLYKVCKKISPLLNFALPASPTGSLIGLAMGAALLALILLVELINIFLTDIKKTLSKPRLLLMPVSKYFMPKNSITFATKNNISIVEDDVYKTLENFDRAFEAKYGHIERRRIFTSGSIKHSSSIYAFYKKPTFDRQVIDIIFEFVDGPEKHTKHIAQYRQSTLEKAAAAKKAAAYKKSSISVGIQISPMTAGLVSDPSRTLPSTTSTTTLTRRHVRR